MDGGLRGVPAGGDLSMGHGHSHAEPHGAPDRIRRSLAAALGVTLFFMLVEFAGGWFANSLALMSDAAHVLSANRFAMSFDGSGSLPGVVFADEDVLEYDLVEHTWEITYDGSAEHASWDAPNLDAVALPPPPPPRPAPSCGIGPELAFLMPLLLGVRRRRGSGA